MSAFLCAVLMYFVLLIKLEIVVYAIDPVRFGTHPSHSSNYNTQTYAYLNAFASDKRGLSLKHVLLN